MKIYQVGGVVRDELLGHPNKDRDWVIVGTTPQTFLKLGYTQVGKDFPVFLHPDTHEEYALARTERKIDKGYTGFTVYAAPDVSLEEDLQRRDLTINAMAKDAQGQLIDPFNGQADLKAGILRHVSPAFIEDPVRILRIARFAARFNFNVADETQQLMQTMVKNGEVDALVAERVWQEMVRALTEPYPQRFFEVLRNCGALAVMFPEINDLFGVPQPEKYHPEIDTGIHTLMCLQQARGLTNDSQIMFAVLMHDLGKAKTDKAILPSHYGHEERGVKLVKQLCHRYRVPTQHRELAILMTRYHTHCHQAYQLKAKTIVKLFQSLDAFRRPQRFEQFLLACQADAQGRTDFENDAYPQADLLRQALAQVNQVDVKTIIAAGFTGAKIGEQLHKRRLNILQSFLDKAHHQKVNNHVS